MKVPEKYEPKNTDEFGTLDRAMTKATTVNAAENAAQDCEAQKAKKEI